MVNVFVTVDTQVQTALRSPVLETATTGGTALMGGAFVTTESVAQIALKEHVPMTAMTMGSV